MAENNRETMDVEVNAGQPDGPGPAFPAAGFRIGEYEIQKMLGHGSMSTVFEAMDATGHLVALKVFRETPNVSATMLERFRREVEASKNLREHPNIMTVYATGKDEEFQYIAMEDVETSTTLESLLEQEQVTIDRSVHIAMKMARALAFAHEHHILHRDVKPTNIMINTFGEPLLSDFGVAALIEWPKFTVAGALTGTPMYMSPEQASGDPLSSASDIYSLGVVLYEMLTGVMPYNSQHLHSVPDTLRAVQHDPPRRPRHFREEISRDLEAVVLCALEKKTDRRYADCHAFADDLENALAGRRVRARHYSVLSLVRHTAYRYKSSLAIAAALLLVSSIAAGAFVNRLRSVHYEGLIGLARLRNSQDLMERLTRKEPPERGVSQAQQHLREARKLMAARNWQGADEEFQQAIELSSADRDQRSVATAQLEQARCAILLNLPMRAEWLYREILRNPDASNLMVGSAQLEYGILVQMQSVPAELADVFDLRALPPNSPVLDAVNCIREKCTPSQAATLARSVRITYQNDTYFSAAIMALRQGNHDQAERYLQDAIDRSQPPNEWPAPYAKSLRTRFTR